MIPAWKPSEADATMAVDSATLGRVSCAPSRKRVAICGFAGSSIHLAPWGDSSYELWGMNQGYINFERRPDRWFEIHQPGVRPDAAVPDYTADLRTFPCPIYTVEVDPAVPASVRYPLERVRDFVPESYRNYFTSSAAYMVALAMLEGFETIGLWGIDCATGTEYELQKPCLEAWIGLAQGRCHNVIIPETSSLFKAPYLYGYEAPRAFPRVLKASETFLRDRIAKHKVVHNNLLAEVHKTEGAVEELEALLSFAEAKGRGARYPTIEGKE